MKLRNPDGKDPRECSSKYTYLLALGQATKSLLRDLREYSFVILLSWIFVLTFRSNITRKTNFEQNLFREKKLWVANVFYRGGRAVCNHNLVQTSVTGLKSELYRCVEGVSSRAVKADPSLDFVHVQGPARSPIGSISLLIPGHASVPTLLGP